MFFEIVTAMGHMLFLWRQFADGRGQIVPLDLPGGYLWTKRLPNGGQAFICCADVRNGLEIVKAGPDCRGPV